MISTPFIPGDVAHLFGRFFPAVFRYYAVVCLPGLHILSRMRRERALAVDDSQAGKVGWSWRVG